MFTESALRGFTRSLDVNTSKLNADAAVALMVKTAADARARVLREQTARSGVPPTYRQVVDGVEDAPLTSVRPDGVIVFAWQYANEVVDDVLLALARRSPVVSGQFLRDVIVLADGVEISDGVFGGGVGTKIGSNVREIRIVATAPYSRRLEVGRRKDGSKFVLQANHHFIEETAIVSRRLFGDVAHIRFAYSDLGVGTSPARRQARRRGNKAPSEASYPTIIIRPRSA